MLKQVQHDNNNGTIFMNFSARPWITLTEFLLKEEQTIPDARGSLTLLLNQIAEAGKIIAIHVKNSGLVDIEGPAGKHNIFQEEVQKLDEFSNDILVYMLAESGQVSAIISEEMEKPLTVTTRTGDYIVYIDPLDGSSNIDTNISVGTIFSVYSKNNGGLLQKGKSQVAAGYILYGTSVMFVYTCNKSVNGFTLDPSIGSFLLSHPNVSMPETGTIYSINEGNIEQYDTRIQLYVQSLKQEPTPYKLRYIGSMVADVHRILLKGGIFMYPADKNQPDGKLRLMLEVNPLSLLVKNAGGKSVSGDIDPLDIEPTNAYQTVPIVMGSAKEVEKYQSFCRH